MRSIWKPSLVVWAAALLLAMGASALIGALRPAPSASPDMHDMSAIHGSLAHAQSSDQNWIGSRYRCVECHTRHNHEVVMPHPVIPTCNECHNGSPTRIGCPSCHSMHNVEYPHEVYPTSCGECHDSDAPYPLPEEEMARGDVQHTSMGYLAYIFSREDMALNDNSALPDDPENVLIGQ
jgi:hypothetical protein